MLTLRPYQQAAIEAIYDYFAESAGNPLVVIPTAGGKSLVHGRLHRGRARGLARPAHPDRHPRPGADRRRTTPSCSGSGPRRRPASTRPGSAAATSARASSSPASSRSTARPIEVQQCDLVLIDEAHLIPAASDTMYRRFLDTLGRINPQLKVIGFTATPYRLDSGMLHEGKDALFTDIAYRGVGPRADRPGLSLPARQRSSRRRSSTSPVSARRGGEFIASELAGRGRPATTITARRGRRDRRAMARTAASWLVFCSGVAHASHVARRDPRRAASPPTRSSARRPKAERDRIIAAFKRGEIRALASMGVLTTGFNAPGVDLIAMLRPDQVGRALRPDGRPRHAPRAGQGRLPGARLRRQCRPARADRRGEAEEAGRAGDGEAPTKVCPECQSILRHRRAANAPIAVTSSRRRP